MAKVKLSKKPAVKRKRRKKSNKGTPFEREICKTFSLWWSEGKNDDIFWRTDNSGGRAKFRKRHKGKDTFGQAGDIQAINPIGQPLLDFFTIELKRGYSKDTIVNMLDKSDRMAVQKYEEHVKQVIEDSKNAKSKTWMLIHRRDQRVALVDFPMKVAIDLAFVLGVNVLNVPHMECYLESKIGKRIKIFTCRLQDFLNVVKPKHIIKLNEKALKDREDD